MLFVEIGQTMSCYSAKDNELHCRTMHSFEIDGKQSGRIWSDLL